MKNQTIIVAPLNWGIGHATRCMPIIDAILDLNINVVIASDGDALKVLTNRYPHLDHFNIASYKIKYGNANALAPLFIRWPIILKAIFSERKQLKNIISKYNCIGVISDNRLGFYNRHLKSVYITHQTQIKTPFKIIDAIINGTHQYFMKKFDTVWIPDYKDEPKLSGELSQNTSRISHQFIGPLSRFTKPKTSTKEKTRDFLIVLSGIEPQKSNLEDCLRKHLSQTDFTYLFVNSKITDNNAMGILGKEALNNEIEQSKYIISRSGYSSIMDWDSLQRQAILIPTPGQTEQEYLSNHLSNHWLFTNQNEGKIELRKAVEILIAKKKTGSELPIETNLHQLIQDTFTC